MVPFGVGKNGKLLIKVSSFFKGRENPLKFLRTRGKGGELVKPQREVFGGKNLLLL